MYYIGIDCGFTGGIIVLDDTGNLVEKIITPLIPGKKPMYDVHAMAGILSKYKDAIVGIEKQQAYPQQGVSSTFKTGRGYGLWEGIVVGLGMSYDIISPKTWQKEVLKDVSKLDTKQAGAVICHRVFPKEDFRASSRCRVDHIGLTDATCIALYVYRTNRG